MIDVYVSLILKEVIQQARKSKEKRQPRQRSVECDSTNFKPTAPVLSIGNKRRDVTTILERMAFDFIPVIRCSAVDFLVDPLKKKKKKKIINARCDGHYCHFMHAVDRSEIRNTFPKCDYIFLYISFDFSCQIDILACKTIQCASSLVIKDVPSRCSLRCRRTKPRYSLEFVRLQRRLSPCSVFFFGLIDTR